MSAILAVGAALAALAGLVWQSQRRLRADLSAGMREAKEDRERLRDEMNARMDGLEARMDRIGARMERMDGRMDGILDVLREQGERLSRIEGMLHLHLGRNEAPTPPLAPAE